MESTSLKDIKPELREFVEEAIEPLLPDMMKEKQSELVPVLKTEWDRSE